MKLGTILKVWTKVEFWTKSKMWTKLKIWTKVKIWDEIKNMDKIMRSRDTYLFQMFIILDMTPHNKIFIFFSGFFIILMRGKITFKIKKRSD